MSCLAQVFIVFSCPNYSPPFEDTQAASGAAPNLELRQQNSGGVSVRM